MGNERITVLVVEPGNKPKAKEIIGSLEAMQEIVGGTIQAIYPFDDPVALIANDDGWLLGLPANRGLRDDTGDIYDIICGAFFLCGAPVDSDSFSSLTSEQIERFKMQFYAPEMFIGMDGRIVCLPMECEAV